MYGTLTCLNSTLTQKHSTSNLILNLSKVFNWLALFEKLSWTKCLSRLQINLLIITIFKYLFALDYILSRPIHDYVFDKVRYHSTHVAFSQVGQMYSWISLRIWSEHISINENFSSDFLLVDWIIRMINRTSDKYSSSISQLYWSHHCHKVSSREACDSLKGVIHDSWEKWKLLSMSDNVKHRLKLSVKFFCL